MIDLSNNPKHRMLYAEPLEGRWLLSGAGSLDAGSAPPRQSIAIDLLELNPANEEDGDVAIAPSSLPPAVLAAIDAKFPGAELKRAEYEIEDGKSEFGVNALHNGQEIEVTLTSDGTIVETETFIPSASLPQAVLDWFHSKYPGIDIEEAAVVDESGVVKYELAFEQPGQGAYEATLGIRDGGPSNSSGDGGTQIVQERPALIAQSTSNFASADREASLAAETPSPEAAHAAEPSDTTGAVPTAQSEGAEAASSAGQDSAAIFRDSIWNFDSEPVSEALKLLAAGTGAEVWLPEAAGVLSNVFSFNSTGVEQGLDRVLDEIDSFAQQVVGGANAITTPTQIAAVAVVLTGTHLVARQSGRRKRGPLLAVRAEDTSWSWVLGAASQTHNGRLLSKQHS